jgi:A/G-specific adenine glycosylase
VVCTARVPACDRCPIAAGCAWRAAGFPEPAGPPARRQPRYEGSDRQRRGLVLAELRASDVPVSDSELAAVLPDAVRRERVLAGLARDGLAERTPDGWALPG